MRILVDADACPVKEIIVELAKADQIPVLMFFDTSHVYQDGYSTSIVLDKGPDSVDYALVNHIKANDIVVTQDYGLGAMALAKQARVIHPRGMIYDNDNILSLLSQRATSAKLRRHKRMKGPKKRTASADLLFRQNLKVLIKTIY